MIAAAVKLAIVLAVVVTFKPVDCSAVLSEPSENASMTCPPWYHHDGDGECTFVHQLPQIVRQYGNSSELEMGFCMTVTNTSIVVAQCPYIPVGHNIHHLYHNIYRVLPSHLDEVNSSLCAPYNRRGFLCSQCKEGHGLAAYRYYGLMCVQCSHNTALMLIVYLALLFVPPTISFLLFFLLKTNIHSGDVTGLIFFAHTITTTIFFSPYLLILPNSLFGYWPVQILMSFYAAWSLDFMQFLIPPFCVSPHLTTLQLISLGYVPSVYPLVLCVLTYYLIQLHAGGNKCIVRLWKPFKKLFKFKAKDLSSILHTFGSFILLFYAKNLFVSFSLLQQYFIVALDQDSDRLRTLPPLSTDLKTPFFSTAHIPYIVIGIVGGLLTVILPLILVLIFPSRVFPKLIWCCGLRRWHAMRTFMEVFTGSYKDGTENGQRDYRIFAALYLIGRIAVALCWANHAGPNLQSYAWFVIAMPFIAFAVIFAFFKPHRKLCNNAVDTLLFLLLAKICLLLHFIFEVNVSEDTLKVLMSIVFTDLAIPYAVYIAYITYNIVHWIYSGLVVRKSFTAGQVTSPLLPKL